MRLFSDHSLDLKVREVRHSSIQLEGDMTLSESFPVIPSSLRLKGRDIPPLRGGGAGW